MVLLSTYMYFVFPGSVHFWTLHLVIAKWGGGGYSVNKNSKISFYSCKVEHFFIFQTIMPFLESEDEMLKILATLTIANIVDEEENKTIIAESGKSLFLDPIYSLRLSFSYICITVQPLVEIYRFSLQQPVGSSSLSISISSIHIKVIFVSYSTAGKLLF